MSGAASASRVVETRSVAVLRCIKRWPTGLDGKPVAVRGSWMPYTVHKTPESPSLLAPLVACPKCGGMFLCILDDETRGVLQKRSPNATLPANVAVGEEGEIEELRCFSCHWYGAVKLDGWNKWQTLWCGVFKEEGEALLRTLYTHAPNVRDAMETILGNRRDRRMVSIAPVIRNDQERQVLLTGLEA